MLTAYLQQQPAQELATAVTTATASNGPKRANFSNSEAQADPLTWRLVNLMAVTRVIGGVRGPLDLPNALRDMRNFVHPRVMKAAYMSEPDLQPEAQAAGAFISAVKRDLSP